MHMDSAEVWQLIYSILIRLFCKTEKNINERNSSRRRVRHKALPDYQGREQTTSAHLRQAALLTKEEAAKAIDMGNFYAVPADNRDLNYDKYFKEGDVKRATIEEFNSDNTRRLDLEETKAKIASLEYIQNELNGIPNLV